MKEVKGWKDLFEEIGDLEGVFPLTSRYCYNNNDNNTVTSSDEQSTNLLQLGKGKLIHYNQL
jgi:hypothetical protein